MVVILVIPKQGFQVRAALRVQFAHDLVGDRSIIDVPRRDDNGPQQSQGIDHDVPLFSWPHHNPALHPSRWSSRFDRLHRRHGESVPALGRSPERAGCFVG